MFVKLILPALLEAKDPGFRPIKYALFPPLGGLHVTALPDEAAQHADTVFLGPGEDTWRATMTR